MKLKKQAEGFFLKFFFNYFVDLESSYKSLWYKLDSLLQSCLLVCVIEVV